MKRKEKQVLPADTRKRGVVRVVGNIVRYDPGLRALRFVSRYGFGTGALQSMWNVRSGSACGMSSSATSPWTRPARE